jgi:hypothetical protein
MDEVVSRSISRERFNMLVMTIFGASALLLAAIGIYGLMSYSVEQRTQEIGIRSLSGARRRVRRMIVVQGMRLALWRGGGHRRRPSAWRASSPASSSASAPGTRWSSSPSPSC